MSTKCLKLNLSAKLFQFIPFNLSGHGLFSKFILTRNFTWSRAKVSWVKLSKNIICAILFNKWCNSFWKSTSAYKILPLIDVASSRKKINLSDEILWRVQWITWNVQHWNENVMPWKITKMASQKPKNCTPDSQEMRNLRPLNKILKSYFTNEEPRWIKLCSF